MNFDIKELYLPFYPPYHIWQYFVLCFDVRWQKLNDDLALRIQWEPKKEIGCSNIKNTAFSISKGNYEHIDPYFFRSQLTMFYFKIVFYRNCKKQLLYASDVGTQLSTFFISDNRMISEKKYLHIENSTRKLRNT